MQSLVKLQPWFLSLQGRPAFGRTAALVPVLAVKDLPLGEHSDGDDDDDDIDI